jgi:hypothetical protein
LQIQARREDELPRIAGLEGLRGKSLARLPGAADLVFTELDPGVPGVHAICGFYMFSVEFRLTGIDYESIGRELGVSALRRFNGQEQRCFDSAALDLQFPQK